MSCERGADADPARARPSAESARRPQSRARARPGHATETAEQAASDPAEREPLSSTSPALSLALYDSVEPGPEQAARTRFSIARTRELLVCSTWSALEGEHFETRRFYAPQGELFYQKLIPFSTDIDEPYPFTQPVAIPHATQIRPVLPNQRGELVVCDPLAVAGAWIGDHQLTGRWRLEVSLDDVTARTLSHRFELVP